MTMAGLPKHKTPDDFLQHRRSSLSNDECTFGTTVPLCSSVEDTPTAVRSSLADRARVFDKSYVESPQKRRTAIDLQTLLDNSRHRKEKNVQDGRRETYRKKNAGNDPSSYIVDSTTSRDQNPILQAMLMDSDHRKREKVSDGIRQTHHPTTSSRNKNDKNSQPFSIIPKGSITLPSIKMGRNMQKLLDDSRHKKLMATSTEHRRAYKLLHPSEHSANSKPAFTFHLRKVKNRTKPALPEGVTPLKPSETIFANVIAPKLNVDINSYEVPVHLKTTQQNEFIKKAMETNTYMLKHHSPAAKQNLIDAMEPVELRKGQILQRQGDISAEDDQMYVVEEGHVNVKVDGKIVGTLKAGDTFGQERLLLRKKNDVTIQAGSYITKLFALRQVTFRVLMQKQYQAVLEELKAKTPENNNSSTWRDDIYNPSRHDDFTSYTNIVHDEDSFGEGSESYNDEYFDEDSVEEEAMEEVVLSLRDMLPPKKPKSPTPETNKKLKRHDFESSPLFLEQESLRKSARKYAPTKDDLDFVKVLGEGQFGEVWLVAANFPDQKPSRREFALKIQNIPPEDELDDEQVGLVSKEAIQMEVKALEDLHHLFICNLVQTYESDSSIDLLLGLIPGGELWDHIHKEQENGEWLSGIPEGEARFFAYVLADTLGFMHSRGYVFRDLKPENVMLDADKYPVIVDFGFAKRLEPGEKTFTFLGTPNYVAPEIILNVGHGKEVDYWALGVVIYEMVSGENPFFYDGMEQGALYQAIAEEDPYEMPDHVTATDQVRELTDLLFLKDPQERLGAHGINEILAHPWFAGMPNLEDIRAKRVDHATASIFFLDDELPTSSVITSDDASFFADSTTQGEWSERHEEGVHLRELQENLREDDSSSTENNASPHGSNKPASKSVWKHWTRHRKGLGYYVDMKATSEEAKRDSKSRRNVVDQFLAQYLEDVDFDENHDDDNQSLISELSKSCPQFFT